MSEVSEMKPQSDFFVQNFGAELVDAIPLKMQFPLN